MNDWVEANLSLLRTAYTDIETKLVDGGVWVRIRRYPLPSEVWCQTSVDVAFRIPATAGEAPYGFWVHPPLTPASPGPISNYSCPAPAPWGDDWGQFSFAPAEPWQPKADVRSGPNVLNFALGIADRLREGA